MAVKNSSRGWLALLVAVALAACSNGRGVVDEEAGAPVTGAPSEPPPVAPAPPPAEPPPTPPPEEPPPVTPPPEEPPPEEPPPQPPPPVPEPPPPEPEPQQSGSAFAGYWRGEVARGNSDAHREGVAFVDAEGNMQLMVMRDERTPEFVVRGTLCCDPDEEAELTGHRYLNNDSEEAEIEATVSAGTFEGRFEFRDRDYDFSLTARAAYQEPLTLATLAGVYTRSEESSQTLTLTIDPDGTLTGSHSNGCIFNGSAAVPDTTRNMVRLQVELSNCGGFGSSRRWNGRYQGLGLLLRNTAPGDTFYYSIVGPTWFGPKSMVR